MAHLGDSGITVLAMGQADPSDDTAPEFFALWELRDRGSQALLLSAIAATGWHDYFHTTIVAGPAVSVEAHLHQLQTVA
ncbi:hypothetical protein IFT84_12030 [Rhizobium sp. CFBP 8762]|uniref:DUF6616 family protein n=1 Tax=Rhizobium sp. CFBP 8762 TaxID=2775279 RepID=UPI00177DA0D6|nr:DUF6616 family protein [Rhizobium sp. CFBP 8762]MBD8555234.1 hypothetical protein [Rhizobium sp. CFBP 8762]